MQLENDENVQKIDSTGVELGSAKLPRVVNLNSSDAFQDREVLLRAGLGLDSLEDVNQGIQAHLYTKPKDVFVLRTPTGKEYDPKARNAALVGIRANARAWAAQTGINLATPENGTVIFANAGETLAEAGARAFCKGQTSALLPGITEEALKDYGFTSQDLVEAAGLIKQLDSKCFAIELLKELGVKVPESLNTKSADFALEDLDALSPDKKFVIKADGSAGGIGVFTNSGQGFAFEELKQKLSELVAEGRLGEQFQIQEFIKGQTVGALAVFDGDGKFTFSSLHSAIEKSGGYLGTFWDKEFEAKSADLAIAVFEKLAQDPVLAKLIGPVGFDAILKDGELFVIEINPRVTGATPVPFLRENLNIVQDFRNEKFDVKSAFLDINVKVPEKLFTDDTALYSVISKARSIFLQKFGQQGGATPLILPQGVTPFATSKILFVNDTEKGDLRDIFVNLLEEQK